MAGIAYVYQGNVVSFDDDKYIDPEFATAKLRMLVDGETHYHGFTSDVTASEYCPLVFNISGTTARLGYERTRSRVSSESEFTEEWSGTGYISTTGTVEEVIDDQTVYTGEYTSKGRTQSVSFSTSWLSHEISYSMTSVNDLQYGTTSYAEMTTATSFENSYTDATITATRGNQIWYRSMLGTYNRYNNAGAYMTYNSVYSYYTKVSSATRTQTNGLLRGYSQQITTYRSISYGDFNTMMIPKHTLTHTATFETLHNINL